MSRCSGRGVQSETKPPVFSSQASLVLIYRSIGTHLSIHCRNGRLSRSIPAQSLNHGPVTWDTRQLSHWEILKVRFLETFTAFGQVSEFDKGRIVAYRDCGLSFREIGSRVGRNQTTVMRICDRWMQDDTTKRRGRSYPPQCTTSREDRQIVHMAVMDRSVTSQTVAQHIESVTHHSVSARTIRCRLQQGGLSTRRPLLGLPLTQNHRCLRHQWCHERRMCTAEWNEVVFTDESRICLQHHDGRIRVWRHRRERMLNSCVIHRHTGPAPVGAVLDITLVLL
ncbi:transposable element Tcb1 transposase [Trichonephila clavipes]|nr:transposable element Tcb1 transposase [Trichonephila clavipes]